MLDLFGPITPAILVTLVVGITQFVKGLFKTPLEDRVVKMIAVGLGVVVGALFQLQSMYNFSVWFETVVYSLMLGLTGVGLFDVGKQLAGEVGKAIVKAREK